MNIPIAPDATEDHDLDQLNVSNVFEIEPSRDEPSEDKGEDELLPPPLKLKSILLRQCDCCSIIMTG